MLANYLCSLQCICACLPGLPCGCDELAVHSSETRRHSDGNVAAAWQRSSSSGVRMPNDGIRYHLRPCKAATHVHEQQRQWMCCLQQMVQQVTWGRHQ